MKILHVITRMDGGGSAVNTLLTAKHQAQAGNDVTLAFGSSHQSAMSVIEKSKVDEGLASFRAAGGKIEIVPELQRELGWQDKAALRALKRMMLQGFDIVHTHTSKAGALGRMAAAELRKATGLKVVHTPHGHIFHGYFGALKNMIFLKVERWLAKKTDVLIALTEAERDDHLALHVGKAEQWRVVPSGVDIEAISDYIWDRTISDEQKSWDTVSVGRLVPIKGMHRLIRAWALVVKIKPGAKLAIVGDGEEKRELERLASRLNILPNVDFIGWDDPLPYLSHAKSFALLSYNEGMGRAVVEAMAASLPCVVSDVCGLKELVDDTVGRCVDADDTQAVANALLTEWSRDTCIAARERSHNYSIATMMNGLDAIYAGLVEGY